MKAFHALLVLLLLALIIATDFEFIDIHGAKLTFNNDAKELVYTGPAAIKLCKNYRRQLGEINTYLWDQARNNYDTCIIPYYITQKGINLVSWVYFALNINPKNPMIRLIFKSEKGFKRLTFYLNFQNKVQFYNLPDLCKELTARFRILNINYISSIEQIEEKSANIQKPFIIVKNPNARLPVRFCWEDFKIIDNKPHKQRQYINSYKRLKIMIQKGHFLYRIVFHVEDANNMLNTFVLISANHDYFFYVRYLEKLLPNVLINEEGVVILNEKGYAK
jgi:hypothetical protein